MSQESKKYVTVRLQYLLLLLLLDRMTCTTYVDAVYCYQPSSVVCRSVCHTSEPCKTAEPSRCHLGWGLRLAQGSIY